MLRKYNNEMDFYERNRNLFYVAVSRPMKKLALLFTQQLTNRALSTLVEWFGKENIYSIENEIKGTKINPHSFI